MHKWLNIGIVHSSFNESRIFFCLNKPPCDDPINRKERNELVFYFSLGKRTYALSTPDTFGGLITDVTATIHSFWL